MIICPHCGRENEDHYKFCLGCGSQLPRPVPQPAPVAVAPPVMIPCPNCSTPVPSNFKFCGACGSPVNAPAAASATVPTPAVSAPEATLGAQAPSVTAANPAAQQPQRPMPTPSTPSLGSAVAKLVVIQPDGSEGATIPLHEGEVVIGRESEHRALASDLFLSPRHAALTIRDGQFSIRDLNSLNGIFYRIRNEQELQHGDYIRLGQELLVFHLMSQVEPMHSGGAQDADTLHGGSPDSGFWGRLALISGPELATRSFVFSEDEVTIGREIGDIVFRDDGFVSGRHARLMKAQGRIILKDLGSSNGTYVKIREQRKLQDGDLILMGQQLFRLVA